MRVLHLSSGGLYGGVETFLVELARRGGADASMEPHYVLTEQGRLSSELTAAGAPIHFMGGVRMRNPLRVRQVRNHLANLLSQNHFDIAVCHSPWAQAIFGAPLRQAGIPLVFYLHGHVTGRHWLERLARRVPPDLIVTNSDFTASTAGELFPGVRCEVLRYPVRGERPALSEAERAELRRELTTPEDDVVIVQTSRMEAWKGHLLHVEALARLADLPGWTCWLVGGVQRASERRYRDELQRRAAELGIADRIRFAGQRRDVPRILTAADVHCQPNMGPEPFGIAFVEALYAGLPVVTTALGGPREIVVESCGVLTPPGDAEALARALRRLITDADRRRQLSAGGPARAAELCDPERQVARFAELFGAVAQGAPVTASAASSR